MSTSANDWAEQAADLRLRAEALPPGEERDQLLARADQLDTAIDMTNMLSVRKPPRGK
jgi:hypothetical protein